jgi:DNA-binding response OmpR family regulator
MSAKPRVLVVEDDADVRTILRVNLEVDGLDPISAPDGVSALRLVADERPDIVLLDLILPALDGWAVLAAMRDMAESPPVVVCSALHADQDRARARSLGAIAFISKPFDPVALVQTVVDVLEGRPVEEFTPGATAVP